MLFHKEDRGRWMLQSQQNENNETLLQNYFKLRSLMAELRNCLALCLAFAFLHNEKARELEFPADGDVDNIDEVIDRRPREVHRWIILTHVYGN